MKKILTILVVGLSVFLIYLGFKDEKIYYLSMGDYLALGTNSYGVKDYGYSDYIKDYIVETNKLEIYVNYSNKNMRTIDLIKDIEDNVKIQVGDKQKTIQNALIKADILTLSIGMNDLLDNVKFNVDFSKNDLYDKLDEVLKDYEALFKLLRVYCKEKIILVGMYNSLEEELSDFFKFADNKIANLASNYDIKYISISDEFKDITYFENNKLYPNKLGHELIFNKIVDVIDNKD